MNNERIENEYKSSNGPIHKLDHFYIQKAPHFAVQLSVHFIL
ncbi:hypothetical protein [Rossellomorea vietnamensis]